MRLPPRDHRWLALPLTVWFAVVACAVCVVHSHAGGSARHVHGCGWNVCDCPLDREQHEGGTEPHRHLILFGVELPGEPLPDTAPAELTAGALAVAEPTPVAVPTDSLDGLSTDQPACQTIGEPSVRSTAALPPRFSRSPRLSTVALRTLCGVLRA